MCQKLAPLVFAHKGTVNLAIVSAIPIVGKRLEDETDEMELSSDFKQKQFSSGSE